MRLIPILFGFLLILTACVIWPSVDLIVSGWFYDGGFIWQRAVLPVLMHELAYYGARILGVALAIAAVIAYLHRKNICGLSGKAWLFLLLGLLLGPALVANVILKDNWGRARPREVTMFGGAAPFTPALVMQSYCDKNCSFIAGDAAFGFYLPSFAYVVGARRRRRVFWGGMLVGSLFGAARIVMGGHFLSDVLFAVFFMLLTTALLHMLMFGRTKTAECWRSWGFK